MSNVEMLKKSWENPGTQYAFISPIYSQAKEQFRRMIDFLPKDIIKKQWDSELRIHLINDSIMEYLSGDNPHSLRGKTLNGVVIDEMRDQSPELWGQIVRPMLTTTKGWASFLSTPRGYDSFYDLAEKAKVDPEWEFFSGPSTCNPLFTADEFEAAKREMSSAEFAQEILAEFRDIHDGSVYNMSDQNILNHSPFGSHDHLFHSYMPIIVGMDFNVSPCAWILGQHNGSTFYFFDEIFMKKTNTQEMAAELVHRVKAMQIKTKPQLIIAGDATGKALKTASVGKSDYSILFDILNQAGVTYENKTPDANPAVKDRINMVNANLKSADGSVKLYFHPNCVNLKKDLQRVSFKPGSTFQLDQTRDPMLTHISDAVGYIVCALTDMYRPSVGGLRIISRSF